MAAKRRNSKRTKNEQTKSPGKRSKGAGTSKSPKLALDVRPPNVEEEDALLWAEVKDTMIDLKSALQKSVENMSRENLTNLWRVCDAMRTALETEGTVEVVPALAFADPKTLTVTLDEDGTASLFIDGGHLGAGAVSGIKVVRC